MAGFSIVMCGISAKDARMLEIVISRAPNLKFTYHLILSANASNCDVALVDAQAPTALSELENLQARFPAKPVVFISDDGTRGDSPYKIARRSLLLQILRILDDIASRTLNASLAQPTPEPAKPAAAAPVAAPPPQNKVLEPLCALVVDDSLTVRTQLQGALDRIGVKGVLAEDAVQALEAVQQRRFELILLDVVMPGMDGYALCRQIKSAPTTRATPVLMLTSRTSPFDRARGALAGCDTYLTKPIDLKSFYRAVDKVLLKSFKEDRKLMVDRGYRLLALN